MEPRREGGALTECQRGALMEAAAGRWRGSGAEGRRFPELVQMFVRLTH